VGPSQSIGGQFELRAGDTTVALDPPISLGGVWSGGMGARGEARRIDVPGGLAPETEYVLLQDGVEKTRFTTGTDSAAPPGTAPVLRALQLSRVFYEEDRDLRTTCVSGSIIDFYYADYDPATLPGAEEDSVLYTLRLYPRGAPESAVHHTFHQQQSWPPTIGERPPWPVVQTSFRTLFDPDLEYCAVLVASELTNRSRAPVESNEVCTTVEIIDRRVAAQPPADGGSDATDAGESAGCASAGAGLAAWAALLVALPMRRRARGARG